MAESAPFAARTVLWLLVVGGLAFAGGLYALLFGDGLRPGTAAPSAFSRSAIGHGALVELLEQAGIPVVVSRYQSAERAGRAGLLIVAEPPPGEAESDQFASLLAAGTVLLVLPKRQGTPMWDKPQWLERVSLLPVETVERVLRRVAPAAALHRPDEAPRWKRTPLGPDPVLDTPQLVTGKGLTPILAADQGMLLAERTQAGPRLWILADPDLLANHGLDEGDNAALVLDLVERLRPPDGVVVVDETIHGFEQTPSLWRALFEFPLVAVTLAAIAAIAVLMWASTGRFGAPQPPARALPPGKAGLIDNTASLFAFAGHDREILGRYLRAVVRDVARRLHAPAGLDDAALAAWLDRRAAARGLPAGYSAIRRTIEAADRPTAAQVTAAAAWLHRWKQEMLHGPGGDFRRQHPAQGADPEGRRRPGPGD